MSSDTVISAENLGKRYLLDHLAGAQPGNFRELLSQKLRLPMKWLRQSGSERKRPIEEFWALKNISFEIERGEVVGIIGRNGAGKSTLLKILSRITEPTTGRVRLRGRVASLLEVGTGFHPELTGRENIFLNGSILGMRRAEIQRKFDEIVAFAGTEQFLDTPVKRYSSGMYVRLAFAVAAHLEPEILVVDEVLAVGDLEFQKKCLGKMSDVAAQEGRTVLFVSHNMGAISALTRKTIYLKSGEVVQTGDTPTVIARYLGDAYQQTSEWKTTRRTERPLQITGVRLFDKRGNPGKEFEAAEGLTLEVEYEVRRDARNTVVELYICTADGTHLITLGDHDRDLSVLEKRLPGRYRSRVEIPGDWLNLGTYYVRINSGLKDLETYDLEEALSFTLVENTEHSPRQKRYGHLVPLLPWRLMEKSKLIEREPPSHE